MFMSHRAWRHAYAAACWQQACSNASSNPAPDQASPLRQSMFTWSSGPTFGVRRPLRHLAWKLNLNETQIRDVVDVLDRLKTAYNQARLDQDRSTSEVAAVFSAAAFDADRTTAALATRTRATEALNQELLSAVQRIFELLNEEQRREFAYLLRSGAFVL
jgi:Spy/CpxP family protein refolding chaperone